MEICTLQRSTKTPIVDRSNMNRETVGRGNAQTPQAQKTCQMDGPIYLACCGVTELRAALLLDIIDNELEHIARHEGLAGSTDGNLFPKACMCTRRILVSWLVPA